MIFKKIFRNKKELCNEDYSKNTKDAENKDNSEGGVVKEFCENKLDLLGIKDGKHAFIGPSSVEIELIGYSNENDFSEPNHAKENEEREEKIILDYEKTIALLKELKSIGTKEINFIGYEEPVEYERILEILNLGKELGLSCKISTRLNFKNKEIIKNIFELGIDCVAVNLLLNQGPFKNEFKRIEENLEFLKECSKNTNGRTSIEIKSIISKYNYKEFPKIFEVVSENSNYSEFFLVNEILPEKKDLFLDENQLRNILRTAEAIKNKCKGKVWQNSSNLSSFIKNIKKNLINEFNYKTERIDYVPCYVGWVFARIMADGSVIPCLKAHKMPMGNIYKESFKEIFFSEEYDKFRYCAKHLDKNNEYFNKIKCYEDCKQNDNNFNIHIKFESFNDSKKEILDYALKLRSVKGMIELLKLRNKECREFDNEQKNILEDLIIRDFKEIKTRIDSLYERIMDVLNEKPIQENENFPYEKLSCEKNEDKEHKVDVFLIMSPPWDVEMPPIGIAYLSSNLKANDIKTEVIDLNIILYNLCKQKYKEMWNPEKMIHWKELNFHKKILEEEKDFIRKVIEGIISKNPFLIGLSINDSNMKFACEFAKMLKQKNPYLKIVVGGPASDLQISSNLGLNEYIDLAVIGEGEIILTEIVNWLKKNRNIECFPKIFLKNGMKFLHSENINDLDKIEFPTYEEFDLKYYEKPTLPILLSRGCINRCRFCSDWMRRKKYSYRSPENVVLEIEHHIKKYGIKSFLFHDLIINGNLENLRELCNLIKCKRLNISWGAQAFVDKRMDLKFLKLLKRAGCVNLVFGVESCSENVLKKMNKNFNVKDLIMLIKRLKKAGIKADFNIIIGYPGEDEVEFKKTYDFILNYRRYINRISSLSPCMLIENTTLSKNIKNLGICNEIKDCWLKWYSKYDNNDYEVRKRRIKEIINLAHKLKIPIALVNLYDENI